MLSLGANNIKSLTMQFFALHVIHSVLSVRLREGYSIQDVSITKGTKQFTCNVHNYW